MSAPLNNDTLAACYIILPSDGNYIGGQSNLNAVNTSPNGEPTSSPGSPLWYLWKPKASDSNIARLFGIAVASGGGFDSYIRIYTGPAPVGGVFPTFNLLTQVGVDDDSGINPTLGTDGYTLPASYPSNNASVRVTIDSTKIYYIAAGGYNSNRNGNFAVDFPTADFFALPINNPPTAAYGSRSYGGGANITPTRLDASFGMTASGSATTSATMQVAKRSNDIVVIPSTPMDSDITVEPIVGPNSLASGPGGVSTVTMGMGNKQRTLTTSTGVSTVTQSLGIGVKPRSQISTGVGGFTPNRLSVIRYADRFTIYPSKPPYATSDVLMGTKDGPGTQQGFSMYAAGVGSMSPVVGTTSQQQARPSGVGGSTLNRIGVTYSVRLTCAARAGGSWYLGSPIRATATSNGQGGSTVNYLGSPVRISATSAGRGGARDQFGTIGFWYLGSSVRMTATSAGRGGGSNYLGTRVYITATSAGAGGARSQFGGIGSWYLGSSTRMAMTASGRATVVAYASSRIYLTSTSAGRATAYGYLSSPIRASATAAGKGGGILYMGSRVYMSGTSPGRSNNFFYQGGTFLLPNITMRGVAHWSLGPQFIFSQVMQGVGHVNDIRLTGTQRHSLRSNGVGFMRENTILLRMTINGSANGTEFDKPPFAFVVYAGCNAFRGFAQRIDSGITANYYGDQVFGCIFYMSAPIRFRNQDSNIEGRGNASMSGRSTFTFPYEMVAISNAGCNAYTGYRSDQNPAFGFPGFSDGSRQGVYARQTSPDYMYAVTNSYNYGRYTAGAQCFAYMSSRVYQEISPMAGRAFVQILRINEADFHGVGGGDITLGVDNRRLPNTVSNGVGAWPINYLPDVRIMNARSNGVAGGRAYQAGNVHFDDIFFSHGVGTFFIDPGLLIATSHGVGHMNDITRPTNVFMQWGLGPFYYVDADNFPVSDPLLIPKSSAGISHMEIEIDTVPIMRNIIRGKATGRLVQGGILRQGAIQRIEAGCYPWVQGPVDPDRPGQEPHFRYPGYVPSGYRFHTQGVEAAFPPVEVVFNPNGIGRLIPRLRLYYALVWDSGNNEFFDGTYYLPTGQHPTPFTLSGSGGRGHFYLAGPRQVQGFARGVARLLNDMSGIFSVPGPMNGVSTARLYDLGSVAVLLYGDMLAQNFSNPTPAYGQLWPRRFHLSGLPV